jgi:hypothetical protein
VAKSIVIGSCSGSPVIAPAGLNRCYLAASGLDADDVAPHHDLRSQRARRAGISLHHGLGRAVPVLGRERGGQHIVHLDQRAQLLRLSGGEHPAGHAVAVLKLDALLERLDVLGRREQEEVAHLVKADLPAGPAPEVGERPQAALRDLDVELVGELRPHAAGRLRRRAGRQRLTLHQQRWHACLGQVKQDAGAHHAPADHQCRRSMGECRCRRHRGADATRAVRRGPSDRRAWWR